MGSDGETIFVFQFNLQQEKVKGGWVLFHLCQQRCGGRKTLDGIINIPLKISGLQDMAEHGFVLLCSVRFIADSNLIHRHSLLL